METPLKNERTRLELEIRLLMMQRYRQLLADICRVQPERTVTLLASDVLIENLQNQLANVNPPTA